MKKRLILLLFVVNTFAISALGLDALEILQKVDDSQYTERQIIRSSMTIHSLRGSRTIESKSWIIGIEKSFTEILAPARDKGTKMLKLEDNLWTYHPRADRIIRIAGHMLRQSMMGSDLSYEDMMEKRKMQNIYNVVIERDACDHKRESVGDSVGDSVAIERVSINEKLFKYQAKHRPLNVDSRSVSAVSSNDIVCIMRYESYDGYQDIIDNYTENQRNISHALTDMMVNYGWTDKALLCSLQSLKKSISR